MFVGEYLGDVGVYDELSGEYLLGVYDDGLVGEYDGVICDMPDGLYDVPLDPGVFVDGELGEYTGDVGE